MKNRNNKRFRLRSFISFSLFFSFIFLAFSGLGMYLRPEGSVARWIGWTFLGMGKKTWEGLHTVFAITFLIVVAVHLVLNIKTLFRYLSDKATRLRRQRFEWLAALVVVCGIFLMAVFHFQPVWEVMDFRGHIKEHEYSVEVPSPEADFERKPLSYVADFLDFSLDQMILTLEEQGLVVVDSNGTLEDVARMNNLSPQEVYARILQNSAE